ncbi:hypothetical protein D3C81_1587670 [compost metagenome]
MDQVRLLAISDTSQTLPFLLSIKISSTARLLSRRDLQLLANFQILRLGVTEAIQLLNLLPPVAFAKGLLSDLPQAVTGYYGIGFRCFLVTGTGSRLLLSGCRS